MEKSKIQIADAKLRELLKFKVMPEDRFGMFNLSLEHILRVDEKVAEPHEYILPNDAVKILKESTISDVVTEDGWTEKFMEYNGRKVEITRGDLYGQVVTGIGDRLDCCSGVVYGARVTDKYFIILDSVTDG